MTGVRLDYVMIQQTLKNNQVTSVKVRFYKVREVSKKKIEFSINNKGSIHTL